MAEKNAELEAIRQDVEYTLADVPDGESDSLPPGLADRLDVLAEMAEDAEADAAPDEGLGAPDDPRRVEAAARVQGYLRQYLQTQARGLAANYNPKQLRHPVGTTGGGRFASVGDAGEVAGEGSKEPHEMTRVELAARYTPAPPNNSMVPWQGEVPPAGTWRMDPFTTELEQLRYFDPNKLELTEGVKGIEGREDYQQYIKWAKEGITPPPVTVVAHADDGRLISSNRRRVAAARAAGLTSISAWYSPTLPNGRPLTHRDTVEAAVAAGKHVPTEVLKDYPDLAGKAARTGVQNYNSEVEVSAPRPA
jgi:hypothetical protein